MLPQPVAVSGNGDDHRMVEQAVQEGRSHHRIPEHLPPVGKAQVRGQDHGPLLVAGIDQLEEQAGPSGTDRKKADLVDDQQRGMDMGPHPGLQPSGPFGLDQVFEQRFETPPGEQAQVDFAEFRVAFTNEPGRQYRIHLFLHVKIGIDTRRIVKLCSPYH